jgi:hypothetical protein
MSVRAAEHRAVVSPKPPAHFTPAPRIEAAPTPKPKPTPGHGETSAFEASPRPTRGDLQPVGAKNVGATATAAIDAGQKAKSKALLEKGQVALKEGRYGDAKKAFAELAKQPKENLDLAEGVGTLNADGTHDHSAGGNVTQVAGAAFQKTNVDAAELGLKQAGQLEKMSKVLGKSPVDPNNMTDMKKYFQKFSEGKSTDAVRAELGDYLHNFYAHASDGTKGGVDWNPKIPAKDRPAKMGELLGNQPTDKSGRKIVDCEGFTYLTGAILGGVKNKDNSPRFDIYYVKDPNHEKAVVFDTKGDKKGFDVDNDKTTLWPVAQPNEADRKAAVKGMWNQPVQKTPFD